MRSEEKAQLEAGEAAVERAAKEIASKQPRFTNEDVDRAFYSTIRWIETAEMEEPELREDTREYDEFLANFWRLEPHLAGVVNSAVSLDKNRGWRLLGGRNTVFRYQDILRQAEEGAGWRRYASLQSQAFYTSMVGAITELGRDGDGGPMRAMWHVDSTRFTMTRDVDAPGRYRPRRGGEQKWGPLDFFRTVSLPDGRENMSGAGFCAVARCLTLAKVMYSVYLHDQEELGARAPKGLLLLQNIPEDVWDEAMAAREEKLDGLERQYYGGVAVLASSGLEEPDAKLIALSKLPRDFNRRDFVSLLMAGYALVFNYDLATFWGLYGSGLGSGLEAQVQHEKATARGYLDFALEHQEQIQQEMPDTIHFEYEQRDDQGELTAATVAQAKVEVIRAMYMSKPDMAEPSLITRDEGRTLLVKEGLIPPEWTEFEEEEEATDDEIARARGRSWREKRDRLLAVPAVQRSIDRNPSEPIVRYTWPQDRMVIMASSGYELARRVSYPAPDQPWQQESPIARAVRRQMVLYQQGDVTITDDDVAQAVEEAADRVSVTYASLMTNEPWTEEELSRL